MSEQFMGEIKMVSFSFAPKGWALCNGQILAIQQNQALFSLLGTTYGGNGQTTFALPDLRSRTPMHVGNGHVLGERAGTETHRLTVQQLPMHTHVPLTATAATASSPAAGAWAPTTAMHYGSTAQVAMADTAVAPAGNDVPHENMPPFAVLTFVIALQGIFPSRN